LTPLALTQLVHHLAALPGSDRTFNPYAPDEAGSEIRRGNLTRFLDTLYQRGAKTLFVLEAPGYRGCARTGIPITSERIMLARADRWGLFDDGYCPTSDHPQGRAEPSATIFWEAVGDHLDAPPLLWNAYPLHPHQPGNRDSNRTPTAAELALGEMPLARVVETFKPGRIFAVGRKAERSLRALGIEHRALRHPSQGGKAAFIEGLRGIASSGSTPAGPARRSPSARQSRP
jgi:hypothetical protein